MVFKKYIKKHIAWNIWKRQVEPMQYKMHRLFRAYWIFCIKKLKLQCIFKFISPEGSVSCCYCFLVVVQSLIHVCLFVTPWTAPLQASLSFYLPEFTQIHVHWVSDAVLPSYPLLAPLLSPSVFSTIRIFSKTVYSLHWMFSWNMHKNFRGPSTDCHFY